jgi:hypothetical protein
MQCAHHTLAVRLAYSVLVQLTQLSSAADMVARAQKAGHTSSAPTWELEPRFAVLSSQHRQAPWLSLLMSTHVHTPALLYTALHTGLNKSLGAMRRLMICYRHSPEAINSGLYNSMPTQYMPNVWASRPLQNLLCPEPPAAPITLVKAAHYVAVLALFCHALVYRYDDLIDTPLAIVLDRLFNHTLSDSERVNLQSRISVMLLGMQPALRHLNVVKQSVDTHLVRRTYSGRPVVTACGAGLNPPLVSVSLSRPVPRTRRINIIDCIDRHRAC